MSILLVCQHRESESWYAAFKEKNPDLDIQVYPDVDDAEGIEFAISCDIQKVFIKIFRI